jgi:hypothetical protein
MIKIRYVLCALLVTASAAAFAGDNKPLNPPRVYTGIYQPHGKPTKSSAFAPRASHSGRHVYGAPIQKPILKMQPKKPTPAAPKVS